MNMKNKKQVLKLFSALVIIIHIQGNEQDGRFKHQIYSNMVLSMLRILRKESMGHFRITIWSTHLNNRISVSANDIIYNWILKGSNLLAS